MSDCLGGLIFAEPVFEILTSTKSSAFASKDDDPEGRLRLEPVEDAANVFFKGVGHCVELLWPVQGHLEHMTSGHGKDEVRAYFGHRERWWRHVGSFEAGSTRGTQLGEYVESASMIRCVRLSLAVVRLICGVLL